MGADQEPDREPKVINKRLPVHNWWKQGPGQEIGHIVVSSGPPPTFDELSPTTPPEVQAEERRRMDNELGVGSFAARTEAGMRKAEERAEIVREDKKSKTDT